MDSLTDEFVVNKIFGYLKLKDIMNLMSLSFPLLRHVTILDCGRNYVFGENKIKLNLRQLVNLTSLNCNNCGEVNGLEKLIKLTSLTCNTYSNIHELENLTNLTSLECCRYEKECDISKLSNLLNLGGFHSDGLYGINNLTNLTSLDCRYTTHITNTDINNLINLTSLHCSAHNDFEVFDVSNLIKLKYLVIIDFKYVKNMNKLNQLTYLECMCSQIDDISNLNKLTYLNYENSHIVNINNLKNLKKLELRNCPTIDVSNLNKLTHLLCEGLSQVIGIEHLTNLMCFEMYNCLNTNVNLNSLINLKSLNCWGHEWSIKNLKQLKYVMVNNIIYGLGGYDMDNIFDQHNWSL